MSSGAGSKFPERKLSGRWCLPRAASDDDGQLSEARPPGSSFSGVSLGPQPSACASILACSYTPAQGVGRGRRGRCQQGFLLRRTQEDQCSRWQWTPVCRGNPAAPKCLSGPFRRGPRCPNQGGSCDKEGSGEKVGIFSLLRWGDGLAGLAQPLAQLGGGPENSQFSSSRPLLHKRHHLRVLCQNPGPRSGRPAPAWPQGSVSLLWKEPVR